MSEAQQWSAASKKSASTDSAGNAGSGGNVIAWLAQKAGPAVSKQSKGGALEYFAKQQTGASGSVPLPRSKRNVDEDTPGSKDATPAVSNPVAMLARMFPQKQQQPQPQKHQDPAVVIQGASRVLTPPPPPSTPPPPPPPATAAATASTASSKAAPATRQQRQQQATQQRRQTNFDKKREAEDAAMRLMTEQHEKSMTSDPQYRSQYEERQELHRSAQVVQMTFSERYQKQEHINVSNTFAGSLDIPYILKLIDEHQVTFICTDTGTGKSTSVPKALLEMSPDTRIVSTQPRRTGCIAIANRVASLRREAVGEDVGYWIRGDKQGDEQTRLWYMTSYTLLLYLLNNPLNPPFTHILLDEFHERQPDLEVTVALLRLCLLQPGCTIKLVLMSATLNTDEWESYFTGLSVATYKQSEPEHPVHDYFMEDVCGMLGMPYAPAQHISTALVDQMILESNLFIAQNLIQFINAFSLPQHSILVFLPGRAQVENFQFWLESTMANRVDTVPWHSAVDLSVIEAAIKRQGGNRQKIYLATDIAEVSITLPDVVFVIDLLLVKRPHIALSQPATIMFPPLVTQYISKGSVAQRRGRAGRVQQGFYFCLLSRTHIPSLLDHSAPPVEHARIDELSLHCMQLAANPAAVFSICHGQPMYETIVTAMATLTSLGCIINKKDPLAVRECIEEVHSNALWSPLILQETRRLLGETAGPVEEYQCTFIGRLLQLLPVSAQQGMLIFYGFLTGLESLMVLAAAVTSSLSPFSLNVSEHQQHENGSRRKKTNYDSVSRAMEQTEAVMKEMGNGLRSDIVAIMTAVIRFKTKRQQFGGSDNGEDKLVRQWCRQMHMSYDKLTAIVDLELHIKYELASFIPFRDIDDLAVLSEQLERIAPMVLIMTNAAFAAQALEVTSEGNSYLATKEGAVGIFTELKAVPDLHSPSCLRWERGDIIVPVTISLHYSRMLVSFSTAITANKQFWLSILLFSHRLQYATFSDDQGRYTVFRVAHCDCKKYIEVDSQTGFNILQFRERLSNICAAMRLTFRTKDSAHSPEELAELFQQFGLRPMQDQQREIISILAKDFFSSVAFAAVDVVEVAHEEDDLDGESILSFQLKNADGSAQ